MEEFIEVEEYYNEENLNEVIDLTERSKDETKKAKSRGSRGEAERVYETIGG